MQSTFTPLVRYPVSCRSFRLSTVHCERDYCVSVSGGAHSASQLIVQVPDGSRLRYPNYYRQVAEHLARFGALTCRVVPSPLCPFRILLRSGKVYNVRQ